MDPVSGGIPERGSVPFLMVNQAADFGAAHTINARDR
jgi:hypothetical protein